VMCSTLATSRACAARHSSIAAAGSASRPLGTVFSLPRLANTSQAGLPPATMRSLFTSIDHGSTPGKLAGQGPPVPAHTGSLLSRRRQDQGAGAHRGAQSARDAQTVLHTVYRSLGREPRSVLKK
jgi:hypothetical protein